MCGHHNTQYNVWTCQVHSKMCGDPSHIIKCVAIPSTQYNVWTSLERNAMCGHAKCIVKCVDIPRT